MVMTAPTLAKLRRILETEGAALGETLEAECSRKRQQQEWEETCREKFGSKKKETETSIAAVSTATTDQSQTVDAQEAVSKLAAAAASPPSHTPDLPLCAWLFVDDGGLGYPYSLVCLCFGLIDGWPHCLFYIECRCV